MTNPENRDLTPPVAANARIDAALQIKPDVQVPEDFAAKVAVLAIAQGSRPRRRAPQVGRRTALLLAPLIAVALFALAPHAAPSVKSILFDTEVILIAQLALIGWWITRAPNLRIPR